MGRSRVNRRSKRVNRRSKRVNRKSNKRSLKRVNKSRRLNKKLSKRRKSSRRIMRGGTYYGANSLADYEWIIRNEKEKYWNKREDQILNEGDDWDRYMYFKQQAVAADQQQQQNIGDQDGTNFYGRVANWWGPN
jgi:hypothetical protein